MVGNHSLRIDGHSGQASEHILEDIVALPPDLRHLVSDGVSRYSDARDLDRDSPQLDRTLLQEQADRLILRLDLTCESLEAYVPHLEKESRTTRLKSKLEATIRSGSCIVLSPLRIRMSHLYDRPRERLPLRVRDAPPEDDLLSVSHTCGGREHEEESKDSSAHGLLSLLIRLRSIHEIQLHRYVKHIASNRLGRAAI